MNASEDNYPVYHCRAGGGFWKRCDILYYKPIPRDKLIKFFDQRSRQNYISDRQSARRSFDCLAKRITGWRKIDDEFAAKFLPHPTEEPFEGYHANHVEYKISEWKRHISITRSITCFVFDGGIVPESIYGHDERWSGLDDTSA